MTIAIRSHLLACSTASSLFDIHRSRCCYNKPRILNLHCNCILSVCLAAHGFCEVSLFKTSVFCIEIEARSEEPSTVVIMACSSGQHNASDHSDLEESSHETSARKGKLYIIRHLKTLSLKAVFVICVANLFNIH